MSAKSFTYTIFVDDHATGEINDIDLPAGTTAVQATSKAKEMAKKHQHNVSSIRLAAYMVDQTTELVRCIWANEVAFDRGIVFTCR